MTNTIIKWVTMTYFLVGTIVCVSLYLLKRFTTVDVIEQENVFTKSPNAILKKTIPITMVSELPPNVDIDSEMKQRQLDLNENECDLSSSNAILMLSEIVSEAAKTPQIDDNSQMEKNSN